MTSKRQHFRLWFECLQICHQLPEFRENLEKSKSFYQDWGDVVGIRFDEWWNKKKYLFEELFVTQVDRVSKSPRTVTVSIPINENVSTILKDVKKIVEEHQTKRLAELGINPVELKSKALRDDKYRFTQRELKGKFHYINLEIYKIYLDLGKPPINRDFLIKVRESFDQRKRSKLANTVVWIPQIDELKNKFVGSIDVKEVVRTVRRGIKQVENTLDHVSRGKFP